MDITKFTLLLFFYGLGINNASSQEKGSYLSGNGDSLNNANYASILKLANVKQGLLTVYQVRGKYYLELDDSLLNKELLAVVRVERSGASSKAYPGDEINNLVIYFERTPEDKILIRKASYRNYAGDSTSQYYQVVNRSNFEPIINSFPLLVRSKSGHASIIDFTSYLQGDNDIFSFGNKKQALSLQALLPDRSYINQLLVFPQNMEVSTTKTFMRGGQGVPPGEIGELSFQINTSIVRLPRIQAKARIADLRVGYFGLRKVDFSSNPDGVVARDVITRWRLEPKESDMAAYKEGQLVTPKNPIIFYIDPATPKKWVSYLIKGVNSWQAAFERAGFRQAIFALEAPDRNTDSTWSLYDARHSAIVWKPSEIKNAFGPSIIDPRTGEILESHISFYQNVIQLVHDWYMVQCGTVDKGAQKMVFDDTLMGKLIQSVITHEVGHTLGLAHNFGASSTVKLDSLKSKNWVQHNGICPSIMDYARFNYVAEPKDSLEEADLLPGIGEYDKWAIEWGYKYFFDYPTAEAEKTTLSKTLSLATQNDMNWFGSEHSLDPRCQAEDLSSDALLASKIGIRNLKVLTRSLIAYTNVPGEGYDNLNRVYTSVQDQFVTYLGHVVKYLWGTYETLNISETRLAVYSCVPVRLQKGAMSFLNENLFKTPAWILDTAILNRTGQTSLGVIRDLQDRTFQLMLSTPMVFAKYARAEKDGEGNVYSLIDMLNDLKKEVWQELYTHKPIDKYRQSLQLMYLKNIADNFHVGIRTVVRMELPYAGQFSIGSSEVIPIVLQHLNDLGNDIKEDLKFIKDQSTRYHLEFILTKITDLHLEIRLVNGEPKM